MSSQTRSPTPMTSHGGEVQPDEISGWSTFAAMMLGIVGTLNVVYGIAAIDNANFYVNDAKFVLSDLKLWGWVLLVTGVVQLCAMVSIFAGTSWGRWVGVLTAAVNSIAQLLFLPSSPFLALVLFSVDVLVMYGLITHGGRPQRV